MSVAGRFRIDEEGRVLEDASHDAAPLRATQSRRIRRADEIAQVSRERLLDALGRAKRSGISGFRDKYIVVLRPSSPPGCFDMELRDGELGLPPAALLRDLFELTSTEANVALAVAEGANAKDLAERFSISNNTARVHVQRILSKTGCNRQTHLVRLILSLGGASTPDGGEAFSHLYQTRMSANDRS